MTREAKIFLGVALAIISAFGFLNFELAVDSNNKSTANQLAIDSLENRINKLEEALVEKQDTVIINNYVIIKKQ